MSVAGSLRSQPSLQTETECRRTTKRSDHSSYSWSNSCMNKEIRINLAGSPLIDPLRKRQEKRLAPVLPTKDPQ
ncbi:hypothetical protein ACROYT_G009714 [Oculina patagonica]